MEDDRNPTVETILKRSELWLDEDRLTQGEYNNLQKKLKQ